MQSYIVIDTTYTQHNSSCLHKPLLFPTLGPERPEHLHCNFLSKELRPLSFSPRTGNFICNYAVPQNRRGDVDPVLPRELDYT